MVDRIWIERIDAERFKAPPDEYEKKNRELDEYTRTEWLKGQIVELSFAAGDSEILAAVLRIIDPTP